MDGHAPISCWSPDERPRERLLAKGAMALSDAELIAILLHTGGRGATALDVARAVLQRANGLQGLGKCSAAKLSASAGIGPAKAARLLAACELGRRREASQPDEKVFIRSPGDAARVLSARLRDKQLESMLVLLLDTKHRLLAQTLVSSGSLDQTSVHPREVFGPALEHGAAAVIVAHNHPSGDPQPSQEDLKVTECLRSAARILGIRLLDHIIIGEGTFVSLAEKGCFKKDGGFKKDPIRKRIAQS